jgi:hypothetical protein
MRTALAAIDCALGWLVGAAGVLVLPLSFD